MTETAEPAAEPATEPAAERATEPAPQQTYTKDDYYAAQEAQAKEKGWTDLPEWLEEGHPPEKWVSAEVFNTRGEFIGQIKSLKAETDQRIAGLNSFHEAQMKTEIERLQLEKLELVEKGGDDAVKGVKAIDAQIASIQDAQPSTQTKSPIQTQWELDNPWINEPGAKSMYAQTIFNNAKAQGYDDAGALTLVDQAIAKEFPKPTTTPAAPAMESGSKPKGQRQQQEIPLTMADLTAEEKKYVAAFPNAWPDEKSMLKAVADSRKTQ